MRTIRISEEVWGEIAKRGKFGETPDDVLRRVFDLDTIHGEGDMKGTRKRIADKRLTTRVANGELFVGFEGGPSNKWVLPPKDDKNRIRAVRNLAVQFAEKNGATLGQANAVIKALTDHGYWLTK